VLAYYTGPLGFHSLFVYGDVPFYANVARDEAILAIRQVSKPEIDHTGGDDFLSGFDQKAPNSERGIVRARRSPAA
jgi:hypothetical protein